MQDSERITNPKRKALNLNLDPYIYGSFAEIGAGQDVARRFFDAGSASGTIAKTISAYDMVFSDSLYGESAEKRYVSESRLRNMLDVEFNSITNTLKGTRAPETCYFSFADTVAAINYKKDNEPHGWMGMRFQLVPDSDPCEVILHVRMLEQDYFLQQRTLGILGVNLIYACYHYFSEPVTFIKSLLDYLSPDQIEIDMMHFCESKSCLDNRLLAVLLVKYGLTKATMFDRYNQVHHPGDFLYKKDVMLLRGSFRPITYVGMDMLRTGAAMMKKDINFEKNTFIVLCEVTMDNILEDGDFNEDDFLNRADLLCGMGVNVMISNYKEHYRLLHYFSRFKIRNLGLVIGLLTLTDVFDPKYYKDMTGGLLEAFSKLFIRNMKLYVYPALHPGTGEIQRAESVIKSEKIRHLFNYLKSNRKIIDIEDVRENYLHIFSRDVMKKIRNNEKDWEKMVPKFISKTIKERGMFGYKN